MNLVDYARTLFPGATDAEIDFLLWECTCFPMDNREAAKQLRRMAAGWRRKLGIPPAPTCENEEGI